MDGPIWYLIAATASLPAGVAGWLLARPGRARARWTSAILLGLLLAKSAFHYRPDWEWLLFPWPGYLAIQPWWQYPVAVAFFTSTLPQLATRWNRWVVGLVAVGLWGCGLAANTWMLNRPVLGEPRGADLHHHCRQSTQVTCAPAAGVTLLSYWGIATTEREMARLCLTRDRHAPAYLPGAGVIGSGTSYFNLYRGLVEKARGRGLRVRIVYLSAAALADLRVPCITGLYHATTVYGIGGRVILHDPLGAGPELAGMDLLQDQGAGIGVLIEGTDGTRPEPPAEPRFRRY